MNPRTISLLALALSLAACGVARAQQTTPTPAPAPVQVMVLGLYHFDNPGSDLHNVKADDVLTKRRQDELADLATRLATFQPTKIAVEGVSDRPDLAHIPYEKFTPETLDKERNERVQIGYRLAHRLGQKTVYGIDEQSDKIDYFPFDAVQAYAKEHGGTATLDGIGERMGQLVDGMTKTQATEPVRLTLARFNDPANVLAMHREGYYTLLAMGDATHQPGADLNGAWYLRNAKIFAKLMQIARPGDRVLVVYGAGHCYWLRHFVENTPGFQLADPSGYLRGTEGD